MFTREWGEQFKGTNLQPVHKYKFGDQMPNIVIIGKNAIL